MYDLIVIGGGPAGYMGAERAAHAGLKTLMIEKAQVGGVCLNEGCIPTKSLLYSAKLKDGAAFGKKYGVTAENISLDHAAVVARKNKVVSMLVGGVKVQLKSAGAETISGEATVTGRNADGFEVACGDSVYTGKRLLIASGSVPVVPSIPGINEALAHGFALTNKEILELDTVPKRLAVIGGGVIGLEMAGYFASAGSEVTVIEMLEMIGGGIEPDIAKILMRNLEKKGIRFMLGCKAAKISENAVFYRRQTRYKRNPG